MPNSFLIIDDDPAVRTNLEMLIVSENLGRVIATLDDGRDAAEEILRYKASIVLLDLLLPGFDGIAIIRQARARGYDGHFVMISQVEGKEMITKAYEAGVEFFISKPLNIVEVRRVLKNVVHMLELEHSLSAIRSVLQVTGPSSAVPPMPTGNSDKLVRIFVQLGIKGDSGTAELRELVRVIQQQRIKHPNYEYRLRDIYQIACAQLYGAQSGEAELKRMEQRVRRVIQHALTNIASLGNEDYYDTTFTEYSSLLFEFKEVRAEMRYLTGNNSYRGKTSIKKFIEGLCLLCEYKH